MAIGGLAWLPSRAARATSVTCYVSFHNRREMKILMESRRRCPIASAAAIAAAAAAAAAAAVPTAAATSAATSSQLPLFFFLHISPWRQSPFVRRGLANSLLFSRICCFLTQPHATPRHARRKHRAPPGGARSVTRDSCRQVGHRHGLSRDGALEEPVLFL